MNLRSLAAGLFAWLLGAASVVGQVVSVDEPAVCLECHSDISAAGKTHVHAPFEDGKCSSCHNPHAAKHASLLDAELGELCLSCHEGVQDEMTRSVVHRPVMSGDCGSCHDPHASRVGGLLKMGSLELCQECHTQVQEWTAAPVVHDPVRRGRCVRCHVPHGSDSDALVSKSVPGLCLSCHSVDQAFTRAHRGRNLANADCSTCHDPHAGTEAGLLRRNQHAPFAGGDCSVCHGSGSQGGTYAIQTDLETLCLKCHRGIEKHESDAYHGHLDQDDSCVTCHSPHASNADFLMASEQKIHCMRCHFREEGVDTESMLTHDGMNCSNCHAPHGSDNEKYLTTLDVDLCSRCHAKAHRITHPVGGDVIDNRTGEQMTCLSCHQLHGAEFPDYLPLDPSMDLCVQCHQR